MEVNIEQAHSKTVETALHEIHRQADGSRHMISNADTKASLLAAGTTPLAGLLLAAPSLTGSSDTASTLAWAGATFMLAGIGCLGAVVWPRLPAGDTGIRASANQPPEVVAQRILKNYGDSKMLLAASAKELSVLSTLALIKFKRLRAAMVCFAIAAVLMLATAIAFALSG
ncbi:Pycsar system effector family protein [Glycomyces paridis]|uniref:Pycsar effector protein domain-containing protein n=1 Tax=Glycomyces paridis TaxID=2126555 RepID=A0A4S8PBZ4_9ACTN|nr:Pycsar system effector family protein [Glycomyces paridis]THV27231.1 hypothetical protein E9998_15315 [Glycomyces paridis]